jgi:hypothetical protein
LVINVFPKEILFLKKDKKSKGRIYKIAALILLVLMGGFLIVYGESIYEKYIDQEEAHGRPNINNDNKTIGLHYVYTVCDHNRIEYGAALPADISNAMNLKSEGDAADYVLPEGWHLTEFDGRMLLTFVTELCPDCNDCYYLGNHEGNIAKFRGVPPKGVLIEELEIEVKDIDKEALDQGVIFYSNEEMIELLENFSS